MSGFPEAACRAGSDASSLSLRKRRGALTARCGAVTAVSCPRPSLRAPGDTVMALSKTERGRAALQAHSADLSLAERRVLILCDGKRNRDDVVAMLGPNASRAGTRRWGVAARIRRRASQARSMRASPRASAAASRHSAAIDEPNRVARVICRASKPRHATRVCPAGSARRDEVLLQSRPARLVVALAMRRLDAPAASGGSPRASRT